MVTSSQWPLLIVGYFFFFFNVCDWMWVKSLSPVWLFVTPMDCSLPGSSVHGILQARILKWVAISFSRGSFLPRDRTPVSCIVGRCFTIWATREAPFPIKLRKCLLLACWEFLLWLAIRLCQMFFLNFLCDHLIFFVVDVMYYINWFLNIELFLPT